MTLLTHDEIRTAVITTLKADLTINAAIKTWLRYLLDPGQIVYPAIYVGTIIQPFDGACGTDDQYTTIADPMKVTVGVLSNFNTDTSGTLGTIYELVYGALKATPELGLSNFRIHSITPIITKPISKCGRAVIKAELTLNATGGD